VESTPKEIAVNQSGLPAATSVVLLAAACAVLLSAQQPPSQSAPVENSSALAGPPISTGGVFPLSQVHRGLIATAWTVFQGTIPEPMQVEILGVLRGARGPGEDMILAQLHGSKPEYTGVVAGMSGSPVYIGDKLLGSLSYRIGQFSKDPIAGITPIEQMLEVRDLPIDTAPARLSASPADAAQSNFQPMETPLVMSGFRPEAIQLWKQKLAGTALESIAAGGMGSSQSVPETTSHESKSAPSPPLEPGSAVSAQLVRGDLEISATCTVTYIDPKQVLACGHPILQAGPVSLPMTTAEVVATLASPLDSFKIVNTGATVGAFTEDRDSGIRGVLGASASMIPIHLAISSPGQSAPSRNLHVDILDLPSLTPQALEVVLFNSLLEANSSSASTSYHLTGSIDIQGFGALPLNLWSSPGDLLPAPMQLAILAGERFASLYSNAARQGAIRSVDLHIETIPYRIGVELESARLISTNIVHAGDTIQVEATLRPFQQPARNVRLSFQLPARLDPGNLRLLISDAATLDRTLNQPRPPGHAPSIAAAIQELRRQHSADRIYVSLLVPEAQAGLAGQTLSSVPLSVVNALEPVRSSQAIALNGESAQMAADAPAGGVLSGFQILDLHIDPGGGLN